MMPGLMMDPVTGMPSLTSGGTPGGSVAAMGGTGPGSGGLLDALLAAHAALCCEPESLAICLGASKAPSDVSGRSRYSS